MKKIVVVEGLCAWNGFIHKMLVAEGYQVQTVRSLNAVWRLLDLFKPDLVLVGIGVSPEQAWHMFRRLKFHDATLPVLVYQIANGQTLEDFKKAVAAVLTETSTRSRAYRKKRMGIPALCLAG